MDKNKLKIALISFQQDAERLPPAGLIFLATYLKERVGLKKENIKIFDKNYFEIEKETINFDPHIIGISAMTINYQQAIDFASKMKRWKNFQILIGGVHISTLPKSLKKCFDVGILGEGEETLKELIELYLKKEKFDKKDLKKIRSVIYKERDKINITKIRDALELDSLPFPDFKFAHPNYFRKEEIPGINSIGIKGYLFSSRGCPYRCVFCSTSRFWGKMRFHSPEYIAKLVERLIKEYNVDYIYALDDLFAISPERLKSIKNELNKKGLLNKIKGIVCAVRANLMSEELCKIMNDIKISTISFGFESGSERMLKYLKAGGSSVEMNKRAIILGKKYKFNIYGSLIYGSPTETIEDMEKTNDFIDFCIKNGALNIWSFIATPFPATPFWNTALERGKVSNNMNFDLLGFHNIQEPLLLDPEISKEEFDRVFLKGRKKLRKLRIRLIRRFLFKNFFQTINLVFKEPRYYLNRIIKQITRQ